MTSKWLRSGTSNSVIAVGPGIGVQGADGGTALVDDRGDVGDRLGDRAADVLLVVDRAGRDGDREGVDPGFDGELGALHVGHQTPVGDVVTAVDAGEHGGRFGHLGHGLGRHERHGLDVGQAGVGEGVDQGDAGLERHRLLRLEPVAGADVADLDRGSTHRQRLPSGPRARPGR